MTLSKIVLLSNYLRLHWINYCFVFSVKISKFLLIIFFFCKQQTISNRMSYFILYSSMTKTTFRDNKQNSLKAKRFLKVISYACAPYIFFNSVCIWVKVLSGTKTNRSIPSMPISIGTKNTSSPLIYFFSQNTLDPII